MISGATRGEQVRANAAALQWEPTAEDLVEWFHGDFSTPMPIDGELGSMGALGPGQRAWIELTTVEPGDHVAICFVPGRDGIPHIAKGMITPFTVE